MAKTKKTHVSKFVGTDILEKELKELKVKKQFGEKNDKRIAELEKEIDYIYYGISR